MRLKGIIKENHGNRIHQCLFNDSNLFITISKTQVSVYDNNHMGDHLQLLSQFHLELNQGNSNDWFFTSGCWILRRHDLLVAVGATDGSIRVLSVVQSKELNILKPESQKSILQLEPHKSLDSVFLSLSEDGVMRIWRDLKYCVVALRLSGLAPTTLTAIHPTFSLLFAVVGNGTIAEINLRDYEQAIATIPPPNTPITELIDAPQYKSMHTHPIGNLKYLSLNKCIENRKEKKTDQPDIVDIQCVNDLVLSTSTDGIMYLWNPRTLDIKHKWDIGKPNPSKVGIS